MEELAGFGVLEGLHRSPRSRVFRSVDPRTGEPVVVKVLDPEFALPADRAAHRYGCGVMRRVGPPAVPAVLDVPEHQAATVLVAADMGAVSLDRLVAHGPPAVATAVRIAAAGARSLAALHAAGFMHLDVCPGNIVVRVDGDDTGARLIDFDTVAEIRPSPATEPQGRVTITPTCAAPEQIGRTGRRVDHRSDLYSLGVTIHHLLTGRYPFAAESALDLAHAHMALSAPAPSRSRPEVPAVIDAIVDRLLAKDPQRRYQSADTLARDLERVADALDRGAPLGELAIAVADVSPVLTIPDRMYGRTGELAELDRMVDVAAGGGHGTLLVAGPPGIGKSSILDALVGRVVLAGGVAGRGRFDPLDEDPAAVVGGAVAQLVRHLLSHPTAEVEGVGDALAAELGALGPSLGGVVPGLSALTSGAGPEPEETGTDAQIGAGMAILLRRLAAAMGPIALVIDDVQWADASSVRLVESILRARVPGLLVVGAYRDTEIAADLRDELERHARAVGPSADLALGPLGTEPLADLLTDTLGSAPGIAELTAAVAERTAGNPFFVRRFLLAIDERGALRYRDGRWTWDLDEIARLGITDNVAELLSHDIDRLDAGCRDVLALAACLGDPVDFDLLRSLGGWSRPELAERLAVLLASSLVVVDAGPGRLAGEPDIDEPITYSFVHDRVREQALLVLDEPARASAHLRIGRLLRERGDASIFDVVNHLNRGREAITDEAECRALATLNLDAARAARSRGAYDAALACYRVAHELGGLDDRLARRPRFDIASEGAATAHLAGEHAVMDELAGAATAIAVTNAERAAVQLTLVRALEERNDRLGSIARLLDVLDGFGVDLPRVTEPADAMAALGRIEATAAALDDAAWLDLPRCDDGDLIAAQEALAMVINSAYAADRNLLPVVVDRTLAMTVEHGRMPVTPVGLASYGLILGTLGRHDESIRWGDLAMRVADDPMSREVRPWTAFLVLQFIEPWRRRPPLSPAERRHVFEADLDAVRSARRAALEVGDPATAGLLAAAEIGRLLQGAPLEEVEGRARALAAGAAGMDLSFMVCEAVRQFVHNLMGRTDDPFELSGETAFDERTLVPQLDPKNDQVLLQIYHLAKATIFHMHDRPADALAHVAPLAATRTGTQNDASTHLLDAVLRLRLAPDDPETEAAHVRAAETFRAALEISETNYRPGALYLEAEHARANGDTEAALAAYHSFVELNGDHGNLTLVPIVQRRAASLHRELGHTMLADAFERMAAARLRQDGVYSLVAEPAVAGGGPGETAAVSVDLLAVLAASEALSGETDLATLLADVLEIATKDAGAERALLFLVEDDEMVLRASQQSGSEPTTSSPGAPVADGHDYLASVVRTVARTREPVTIRDVAASEFGSGAGAIARPLASVRCQPIVSRGAVVGVLYLENNLLPGAFADEQRDVLDLLTGQIAIAIENAQLFGRLHETLDRQVALTGAQSRFVPDEFLHAIGRDDIAAVQLGDNVQKEMTILFSDMRASTTLMEPMTPAAGIAFVNDYLAHLAPAIGRHGGFVAGIQGDGLLALFEHAAEDALHAALAMLRGQRELNERRRAAGEPPVRTGIGINTGDLMLGTVGAGPSWQCTVMGDAVNLASRIEQLTKRYGTTVLMSEVTRSRLPDPDRYHLRRVERVQVMGRSAPVTIFEVFDEDEPEVRDAKLEALPHHRAALEAYDAGELRSALQHFARSLSVHPDDPVTEIYIDRCQELRATGLPEGWDGVSRLSSK